MGHEPLGSFPDQATRSDTSFETRAHFSNPNAIRLPRKFKALKSCESAKGNMIDSGCPKLTDTSATDLRSEGQGLGHASSADTYLEKDIRTAGDDKDGRLSCESSRSESMTKGDEAHGALTLCGCYQCGCYFGSKDALDIHQKVCQGFLYCKSCLVTFAYTDSLANFLPPSFVCQSCGLSFPSDCGFHKGTGELPWLPAWSQRNDLGMKLLGHHTPCGMPDNVFLSYPNNCNTCECTKRRNGPSEEGNTKRYAGEAQKARGNTAGKLVGRNVPRQLSDNWSTSVLKCCKCNITFKTVHDLSLHLQMNDGKCGSASPSSSYVCGKCKKALISEKYLQNHTCISALPKDTPAQKSITPAVQSAKIRGRQEDGPQIEDACRRVGDEKSWLYDHTYSLKPQHEKLLCEVCGNMFPDLFDLEAHAKVHILESNSDSLPRKPAATCQPQRQPKKTIRQNSKKPHPQQQKKQRTFVLLRGDKNYPYLGSIAENMVALINDGTSSKLGNIFQCIRCKLYFMHRENFKQHKCKMKSGGTTDSYVVTNPYLCHYCGLYCAEIKTFMTHMALHWNKKLHTFRYNSLLDEEFIADSLPKTKVNSTHKSAKTADSTPGSRGTCNSKKLFVCQICSKAFGFESQLLRHRNVHRLESRRPVLEQNQSFPDGQECTESTVKGKKGCKVEKGYGWSFSISGTDSKTKSGTRRRGTSGRKTPEGPRSAPRWGIRPRVVEVKRHVCHVCDKAFYRPNHLKKHMGKHRQNNCNERDELGNTSSPELLASHRKNESSRAKDLKSEKSGGAKDKKPSTAEELNSVHSSQTQESMKSSISKETRPLQSGKSNRNGMSSRAKVVKALQSEQPTGGKKSLVAKPRKSLQIGQSTTAEGLKSVKSARNISKKRRHIHTNQSECPDSSVAFASPEGLTDHITSRSDAVSFVCSFCEFAFKSRKSLKTHQLTYHFPKL